MKFWETITGSQLTKDWQGFEARVLALPPDYREAWERVKEGLMGHSDFTGKNLTPMAGEAVEFLEACAADGLSAQEALGDDVEQFCSALAGDVRSTWDFRQKWREQLNKSVERKLRKLGE